MDNVSSFDLLESRVLNGSERDLEAVNGYMDILANEEQARGGYNYA